MTDPNPAPQDPAANPADPNANPNPPADPAATPPVNPPAPDPNAAPAAKAWSDTWRQELAGDDAKALTQLERFTTPKALWDSYQAAYTKIRSGELKAPLPDNATPEQVTAYRAERGIPEKPEGYLEKLPDGLVIGENDRPIFDSFVKSLHGANADPKVAHAAVAWYNNFQQEQEAARREADVKFGQATEDALRSEWGNEYRINKSIRDTYIDSLPQGIKDVFLNSRMPDGRPLGDHPDLSKWLVQEARDKGYSNTIVPGTNGNHGQSLEGEIEKIEKFMRSNNREYIRDEKMQARLRDLYEARERTQKRGQAA